MDSASVWTFAAITILVHSFIAYNSITIFTCFHLSLEFDTVIESGRERERERVSYKSMGRREILLYFFMPKTSRMWRDDSLQGACLLKDRSQNRDRIIDRPTALRAMEIGLSFYMLVVSVTAFSEATL